MVEAVKANSCSCAIDSNNLGILCVTAEGFVSCSLRRLSRVAF